MPFVFLLVGLLLIVSAARGKTAELTALLKSEFWGTGSFVPFVLAFLVLGALGYIRPIKPLTDGLMALIIFGMLVSNDGFFSKLNDQLRTTPSAAGQASVATPSAADNSATLPIPPIPPAPAAPGVGTQQFQSWN